MSNLRSFVFASSISVLTVIAAFMLNPTKMHAQSLEATDLTRQGIERFQQGRYEEAEKFYRRSLALSEQDLGHNRPYVATLLKNIANVYWAQGRYEEAEPLYKRSLAIRENALGPTHPDVAVALTNLAALYILQKRYSEAEPLLKRAIPIQENALGPNHPDIVTSLYKLADLYLETDKYKEAESACKKALAIREQALGSNHLDVAIALNKLANIYYYEHLYVEAEPLYKKSLAIRERALGVNHIDVGTSLNNLANLYYDQKRYAEAESFYKRSLVIQEQTLGPEHVDVAESLEALANICSDQVRYGEAEPLYKRSLAIREKALGFNHPDVATSLNNLATLYLAQKRYVEVESLYKRSLSIREKVLGNEHPQVAQSLHNLADLYYEKGEYEKAEPLFKSAIAIREHVFGLEHISVGQSLNELSNLYCVQGRCAVAEPLLKRALAIYEKTPNPDTHDLQVALNNLAVVYQNQGRFAMAEPLLKRSLAIQEKASGPNSLDVAQTLHNFAALYTSQARYQEAELLYKRSLAIRQAKLGLDHLNVTFSLHGLAILYNEQGRYAEAEPLFKKTLVIREKTLGLSNSYTVNATNDLARMYEEQGRYGEALPLVERMFSNKTIKKPTVSFRTLLGAQRSGLRTASQAMDTSYSIQQFDYSSAAIAVQLLNQRLSSKSPELARLIKRAQDISAETQRLETALVDAVGKPPHERNLEYEAQNRKRLMEIEFEKNSLQTKIGQQFASYAALANPQPISVAETQSLLKDDEAVIVFHVDKLKSFAWVVTKTESFWAEVPTNTELIDAQVLQLRSTLTFAIDKPFDTTLAYRIYQQTFGAIAEKIADKKRLSVVANGALTSIPLQILVASDPTGKPAKDVDYLVKSHAVTILPSIFSLKTMRAQAGATNAPKPMIAFADPVFSKQARAEAKGRQSVSRSIDSFYRGVQVDVASLGEALPQLPATRDEVQKVANALGASASDLKFGLDATASAVENAALDQYRVVYFATHGLVAGDLQKFAKAKAEPALVMSIPEKLSDQDNGLLPASEIATLKLNADWVVLSACNTAAGDQVGAEALSGLARAFIYAGGRSLVVSNWDVSDDGTADLMTKLFDISSKHADLTHGEALQQAELAMLAQAKSDDERHPRYWAPFVVVGEPQTAK